MIFIPCLLNCSHRGIFGIFWYFWRLNTSTVEEVVSDSSSTSIICLKMFKRHGRKHKTIKRANNIIFHPTHRNFSAFIAIVLTRISITMSYANKHNSVINCKHSHCNRCNRITFNVYAKHIIVPIWTFLLYTYLL